MHLMLTYTLAGVLLQAPAVQDPRDPPVLERAEVRIPAGLLALAIGQAGANLTAVELTLSCAGHGCHEANGAVARVIGRPGVARAVAWGAGVGEIWVVRKLYRGGARKLAWGLAIGMAALDGWDLGRDLRVVRAIRAEREGSGR